YLYNYSGGSTTSAASTNFYYSYVEAYDDYFIYSDATNIYMLTLDGTTELLYTLTSDEQANGSIFGLDLVDGVMYYYVGYYYRDYTLYEYELTMPASSNVIITATAGTGGSISPSGESDYTYGSDASYTITPNTGYELSAVTVNGTSIDLSTLTESGSSYIYTFSNITSDSTIVATFTIYTYEVSVSYDSNGTAYIGTEGTTTTTVNYNGSITIYFVPNTGYEPDTVTVNDVAVSSDNIVCSSDELYYLTITNITEEQAVTVTFSIKTYDITATAGDNGSITPAGTTILNYSGSQEYTIKADSGYMIETLTVDDTAVEDYAGLTSATYTFSDIDSDHTIAVTFTAFAYYITYSAGDGGTITATLNDGTTTSTSPLSVDSGDSITFTVTPDSDYTFSALYLDGNKLSSTDYTVSDGIVTYELTDITAAHTVNAEFEQTTFTITASVNNSDAGTISLSSDSESYMTDTDKYVMNSDITFEFTANTGYELTSLTIDDEEVAYTSSSYTFSSLSADHTIVANFTVSEISSIALDKTVYSIELGGSSSFTAEASLNPSDALNVSYRWYITDTSVSASYITSGDTSTDSDNLTYLEGNNEAVISYADDDETDTLVITSNSKSVVCTGISSGTVYLTVKAVQTTDDDTITLSCTANLNITQETDIYSESDTTSSIVISSVSPVYYTGKKHYIAQSGKSESSGYDLNLTVTDDTYTLVYGTDYTVKYGKNTKNVYVSGNSDYMDNDRPYIEIVGKGNYAGIDCTRYFDIYPVDISEATVSGISHLYQLNSGKSQTVTTKVSAEGLTLSKNDYEIYVYYNDGDSTSWTQVVEGATQKFKVSGEGYYFVEIIAKGNFSGGYPLDYSASDLTSSMTFSDITATDYLSDCQFMIVNKSDASALINNASVSIKKKTVTLSETDSDATIDDFRAITVKSKTKTTLTEGTDYELSLVDASGNTYETITTPGTYYVRVTGAGDYSGYKDVKVTVKGQKLVAKNLYLQDDSGNTYKSGYSFDYTGSSKTLTVIDKTGSMSLGEEFEVTSATETYLTSNASSGKYTVVVSGLGIYASSSVKLTFTRKKTKLQSAVDDGLISFAITSSSVSYNINGAYPTVSITIDGTTTSYDLSDGLTQGGFKFTVTGNKSLGTAKVTAAAIKNDSVSGSYSGKASVGSFTIVTATVDSLSDISDAGSGSTASEDAGKVYYEITPAKSGKTPTIKLYQYDVKGNSRKALTSNKDYVIDVDENITSFVVEEGSKGTYDFSDLESITFTETVTYDKALKINYISYDSSSQTQATALSNLDINSKGTAFTGYATYTGSAIRPEIESVNASIPYSNGTIQYVTLTDDNCTYTYSNNVKAGTATVTVKATFTDTEGIVYYGTKTYKYKIK
ncbi:MAG: hypothetical protein K6A23_04185, partial [Butyrivibrio sp.]|nr:hypothetical protein [Butyrivibrio sp.]